MDHGHGGLPPTLLLLLSLFVLMVLLTPPTAAEVARKHSHSHSHRAAGDHTDDTSGRGSNGSSPPSPTTTQQLWVFGDSYADTGNLGDLGRELTHAWYDPYGATFPGRPTGRFSDGRVLTDFVGRPGCLTGVGWPAPNADEYPTLAFMGVLSFPLAAAAWRWPHMITSHTDASAMGLPTPVAYKLRRGAARGLLERGMNFAVGGAGVLDTGNFQRNISAQIDLFQAQQQHPVPAAAAAHGGGVALVVVSGNDYSYAADKDNSTSAAIAYIPTVVRELGEQLRRLRDDVGMRRVVVTNLHPLGCTPLFTRALNYSGCDPLANAGAAQHNAALQSVLAALDPANRTFLLLDLNAPFAAFADAPPAWAASSRFAEPRRPCCETFLSTAGGGYCGQQDDDGRRQYALCDDPSKHSYWDNVHPTQAAWAAVAETFRPKIREFVSS